MAKSRSQRLRELEVSSLSASFASNNMRELLVLEYVENFRIQYTQLFADRPPLFLCPRNEAGVEKFVCSTVRPSQLPYAELYDLGACAQFVADHITYSPLEEPSTLPNVFVSPFHTLKWQVGNCFEMSCTLASLLIGAGYDALVVSGYADLRVCQCDLSDTVCPEKLNPSMATVIENAGKTPLKKLNLESQEDVLERPKDRPNRYKLKERPDLESHFSENDALRHEKETEEAARLQSEETLRNEVVVQEPLYGKRVHSWVILLPGKREVSEVLFVEPSTGVVMKLSEAQGRYQTIESVFNHENMWVNMQSRDLSLQEMGYDLWDLRKWEFIIVSSSKLSGEDGGADYGTQSVLSGDTDMYLHAPVTPGVGSTMSYTSMGAGSPAKSFHSRKGAESVVSGMMSDALSDYARKASELSLESGEEGDERLDLPGSWVPRLDVDFDSYELRFPGGQKMLLYKNCRVELFAPYFRSDGVIHLVSRFFPGSSFVEDILVLFSHRTDKLYARQISIEGNWLQDIFSVGRFLDQKTVEGLQIHKEVKGISREFIFYRKSRLDGQVRRLEIFSDEKYNSYEDLSLQHFLLDPPPRMAFGSLIVSRSSSPPLRDGVGASAHIVPPSGQPRLTVDPASFTDERRVASLTAWLFDRENKARPVKVVEEYEGREDFLIYRSGLYDPFATQETVTLGTTSASSRPESVDRARSFAPPEISLTKDLSETGGKPVLVKYAEKFSRNVDLPADADVAKRTFNYVDLTMRVDFQYESNGIVRPFMMYDKTKDPPRMTGFRVNVFAPKPERDKLLEEFNSLNEMERQAVSTVHELNEQARAIIWVRQNEEKVQTLSTSLYDVKRHKPSEDSVVVKRKREEEQKKAEIERDFISFYLRGVVKEGKELTREQALQVRDEILETYKQRILQRAEIIEQRLEAERDLLTKKKIMFERNKNSKSKEQENEHFQWLENQMFKMHILESRLFRHQEQSLKKFEEMDRKICRHKALRKALREAALHLGDGDESD